MARPETLEDYLVQLHQGQWFGFQNLNGNEANKTYENLIVHDNRYNKPTEQECIDGLEQLKFNNAMQELRQKRNSLLEETDYIVIKAKETGTTIPTAWKTYRQALRDITQGLTTVEEVELVIFPEKP